MLCVHHVHTVHTGPEEGIRSPGSGGIASCEPLDLLYSSEPLRQHWLEMQAKENF